MDTIKTITLLGSGTSTGVPEVGCFCATCLSKDSRDKRTRTSVFLKTNKNKNILIDCSPDFRSQAIRHQIDRLDSIVLTHEHYDHVGGLDDLRTIAWDKEINIYADLRVIKSIKERLHYYFSATPYPGRPNLKLHTINSNSSFLVEGIEFTPIQVFHGKLPIWGFRVENFAFITDLKSISNQELEKIKDLDLLFINGLRFTKPHPTHQTIEEAITLIKENNIKTSYIIHLSHHVPTFEKLKELFPVNIFPSFDGLSLLKGNDGLFYLEKKEQKSIIPMDFPYIYKDCLSIKYEDALSLQKEIFTKSVEQKKNNEIPENILLFCEHEPVFTIGKHGDSKNLLLPKETLKERGVNLHYIERGGDITFHGPGQITGYPIFDLQQFGMGIKQYIYTLEECIIEVLLLNGIKGERIKGATGVWLEPNTPRERKICAIGVHVSRYITLHGFALNVFTDLSYFSWINPCGFVNKGVTSMEKEMTSTTSFELVKQQLEGAFRKHFSKAFQLNKNY